MDFQESTDIWISMIFGCHSSIIHISGDIHIDIQARISMEGHPEMDIRNNEYP